MRKTVWSLLFVFLFVFFTGCEEEKTYDTFLNPATIQEDFFQYYSTYANKLVTSDEMQSTFTLDNFTLTSETLHLEKGNYRPVATVALTRIDCFGVPFGRVEGNALIHYYLQEDESWTIGLVKFQPEVDLFYLDDDSLNTLLHLTFTSEDEDDDERLAASIISLTPEGVITIEYLNEEGEVEVLTATYFKYVAVDSSLDHTHYFAFRGEDYSIWLGKNTSHEDVWLLEVEDDGVMASDPIYFAEEE